MNIINTTLSVFTLLICISFAFYLLMTDFLQPNLSGTRRTILIIILFIYALIRSFRIYKQVKKINHALSLSSFRLIFLISSCSSNDNPFSYGNDTHSRGNTNIYVEGSFKPLFDTGINTFEGQYPKAKISAIFGAEDEIIDAFFKDSTKTICISRDFTKEEKSALKEKKLRLEVIKLRKMQLH